MAILLRCPHTFATLYMSFAYREVSDLILPLPCLWWPYPYESVHCNKSWSLVFLRKQTCYLNPVLTVFCSRAKLASAPFLNQLLHLHLCSSCSRQYCWIPNRVDHFTWFPWGCCSWPLSHRAFINSVSHEENFRLRLWLSGLLIYMLFVFIFKEFHSRLFCNTKKTFAFLNL